MAIIRRRYSEKCFNFLDKFTLRLHSLACPHLGPSVTMEQCPPERSYQLPEPDMQRQQEDSPSLSSFKFWTSELHFSQVLQLDILAGLKLVSFLRYCLWKRGEKKSKPEPFLGWAFEEEGYRKHKLTLEETLLPLYGIFKKKQIVTYKIPSVWSFIPILPSTEL